MKPFLRQNMLKQRVAFSKALTIEKQKDYGLQAARHFEDNFLNQSKYFSFDDETPIIGGYLPYKSEFDPSSLLNLCAQKKLTIGYPCLISAEDMIFTRDQYPPSSILNRSDLTSIIPNFILVPLIAFDKKGYRLGFGKGYYDRYLNKISTLSSNLFTLGLAYEFQKIDNIHPQTHDQKLNAVLTEKKLYFF